MCDHTTKLVSVFQVGMVAYTNLFTKIAKRVKDEGDTCAAFSCAQAQMLAVLVSSPHMLAELPLSSKSLQGLVDGLDSSFSKEDLQIVKHSLAILRDREAKVQREAEEEGLVAPGQDFNQLNFETTAQQCSMDEEENEGEEEEEEEDNEHEEEDEEINYGPIGNQGPMGNLSIPEWVGD